MPSVVTKSGLVQRRTSLGLRPLWVQNLLSSDLRAASRLFHDIETLRQMIGRARQRKLFVRASEAGKIP
jgi:hypothetical protein